MRSEYSLIIQASLNQSTYLSICEYFYCGLKNYNKVKILVTYSFNSKMILGRRDYMHSHTEGQASLTKESGHPPVPISDFNVVIPAQAAFVQVHRGKI